MKNIILLSDGTGNSAAKRQRTNVWRLYRALVLNRADQIAYYDDGVGSQEFLPFKILGGVFGWGLKRNVRELYKFLCRTYKAGDKPDQSDKIYLFGFSRGAFTVRVLSGLIDHCGLYTQYTDEADLDSATKAFYRKFRARFKHGYLTIVFRKWLYRERTTENNVFPQIECVGVWDTVDAYGLPIDELAILWDILIFPIRFPDRKLPDCVNRAYHALSIDDERHTFHPILWDENHRPNDIEQVWFTGVHSDVGGGYAKDSLSLVPLDWMMTKVEAPNNKAPGLKFDSVTRKEYEIRAYWHGIQHDSRSGIAAYYRDKPRRIDSFYPDGSGNKRAVKPKIHNSVFERIKANVITYAPTGLPSEYEVVETRGTAHVYEDQSCPSGQRQDTMNPALNVIFGRRWLYALLLCATVVLFAMRFFLDWTAGGICVGSACVLEPLFAAAQAILPDVTAGWIEALLQNPDWLWVILLAFGVLTLLKIWFARLTQTLAIAAWAPLKAKGRSYVSGSSGQLSTQATALQQKNSVITAIRQRLAGSWVQWTMTWGAASVVLVLVLAALVVTLDRSAFFSGTYSDRSAKSASASQRIPLKKTRRHSMLGSPVSAHGSSLSKASTIGLWSMPAHGSTARILKPIPVVLSDSVFIR